MAANDELFDAQLRHAIGVRRFGGGEVKRILRLLEKSEKEILERVARLKPNSFGTKRYEKILADIRAARAEVVASIRKTQRGVLVDFAKEEQQFNRAMMRAVVPVQLEYAVVDAARLRALVTATPFAGGANAARTLSQWWEGVAGADQRRITEAIQLGMVQGEPTASIVGRVRAASSLTRTNAEAVTRTAVNHVSNSVRDEFMSANADVAPVLRWTATLDGRTSAICRARDGHFTSLVESIVAPEPRLDPPDARPPAHPSCRSVMAAVLNAEGIAGVMGERPFVRDARTRKFRERDFRAEAREKAGSRWRGMDEAARRRAVGRVRVDWTRENVGRVPAATTYDQWLRRQPRTFQDDVLGKGKGVAFRKGLRLDQFVDRRGGELTLEQLRAKYPEFLSN